MQECAGCKSEQVRKTTVLTRCWTCREGAVPLRCWMERKETAERECIKKKTAEENYKENVKEGKREGIGD